MDFARQMSAQASHERCYYRESKDRRLEIARLGERDSDHPGELDGGGVLLFSENSLGRIGMTAIAMQS